MLKLKCKCGSVSFQVNRRHDHVRCTACGTRYRFSFVVAQWCVHLMSLKKLTSERIEDFCFAPPKKFVEELAETAGQWMKRHGIVKEKKKPAMFFPSKKPAMFFPSPPDKKVLDRKLQLVKRWDAEISLLQIYGNIIFTNKHHKGKLRGRDAAKAFHRDLKALGFKTRLTFSKNRSAKVCWENRS